MDPDQTLKGDKTKAMINILKMKIKVLYGTFVLFGICSMKVQAQQNIQFTQYIFNSMSVNPAYAGYKEKWFAQIGLRSQWVGIEGAPKTGQISIDGIIDPLHRRMGIGLQVTSDMLGPQSANSVYANYAYRLRLDNEDTKRLSFGIGLGVTQYALDGTALSPSPDELVDNALPTGNVTSFIPDLRFGIYYSFTSMYLGLSVLDLLSGDRSNNIFRWDASTTENLKRKRQIYLTMGTLLTIASDIKLRPSIMLKEDFKGPTSLDLNAMFIFADHFWVGSGYRTGVKLWDKKIDSHKLVSNLNSFSGIMQFFVNDNFRLGYSYDYIINKLGSLQNGTHEITLGLTVSKSRTGVEKPRLFF